MPILDIILTHYDEPWETGQKFFDMLAMQRGVDFNDIRLYLIQDGVEHALSWETLLDDYPYRVTVCTIEHAGVSAARNTGIRYATSPWITFCDFDDQFSDIFALHKILSCIQADKFSAGQYMHDLMFCDIVMEQYNEEQYIPKVIRQNDVFIHGKYIRTQFLIDNWIRFDTRLAYSEDALFCETLMAYGPAVKEIPEVLYCRCFTENSVTKNPDNDFRNALHALLQHHLITEVYCGLKLNKNFRTSVVRTFADYFYYCNASGFSDKEKQAFLNQMKPFFDEHYDLFWDVYSDDITLFTIAHDRSRRECVNRGYCTTEQITFLDWVQNEHSKSCGNGRR